MKIHIYYSQAHYGEHLTAIWKHLPSGLQGDSIHTRFVQRGDPDDIVMVAGYTDIKLAGGRKVVLVEHGAGQRYEGLNPRVQPFYGGPYPDNVVAYLGPRQSCVDSVGLPGFAIGAPICDNYELYGEDDVVAFTWHWRGRRVSPEADTALGHYYSKMHEIITALRAEGYEVIGHRHPRLTDRNIWPRLGVEEVDAITVRSRASILIADNTSLQYEMSYLLRSNLVLNCPQYRRDVNHGLRFWDNPPGHMVDSPEELLGIIPELPRHLKPVDVESVYGAHNSDGWDGLRAAAKLTELAPQL